MDSFGEEEYVLEIDSQQLFWTCIGREVANGAEYPGRIVSVGLVAFIEEVC